MINSFIKTTCVLTIVATVFCAGNPSFAHPEMDAWGRDITSGPLPAIVAEVTPADAETTGSTNTADDCQGSAQANCLPAAQPKPPKRVHGDN